MLDRAGRPTAELLRGPKVGVDPRRCTAMLIAEEVSNAVARPQAIHRRRITRVKRVRCRRMEQRTIRERGKISPEYAGKTDSDTTDPAA